MIALSFVHPSLAIAGVVAAALPVIIHLINRRRFRKIPWAAMGFLLAANRRSAHRIRLEHMLLLLLRCALLALVGIAAARPIVTGTSLGPLAESRVHHVLIVDNSASMQAFEGTRSSMTGAPIRDTRAAASESRTTATDRRREPSAPAGSGVPDGDRFAAGVPSAGTGRSSGTRLARAIEAADALITSFAATEPVSIFTAAAPAQPSVGFANYDRRQVRDALRQIESTDRATDLAGAMRLAADLLSAAPHGSAAVYVISDLQRSAWSAAGGAVTAARRLVNELGAKLVFVRVGAGPEALDNVALTRLSAEAPLAGRQLPLRLSCEVLNASRTPVRGLTIQVIRDETIARTVDVDPLAPGERRTISFAVAIDAPGTHAVQVRLASGSGVRGSPGPIDRAWGPLPSRDVPAAGVQAPVPTAAGPALHRDALPIDDVRYLSTEVVDSVPVLLVDGRPSTADFRLGGGRWSGQAGYLATAMAPSTTPGETTLLAPRIIGDTELADEPLSSYAMIALCNVARLEEAVWQRLEQFVSAGGGLAIFAGDLVIRDHYNRLAYRDGAGVLPGRLGAPIGEVIDAQAYVRFSPEPSTHPLMADFAGAGDTGLYLARILRYLPIEPDPAVAAVALRYLDGQPAIVTRTLGRGRVCYVSTTANMEWNNLPAKGDFVGLVMSLTAYLAPRRGEQRNVLVGEPLHEPLPAVVAGSAVPLRVTPPSAPESGPSPTGVTDRDLFAAGVLSARTVREGDGFALHFEDTGRAGIYAVSLGSAQMLGNADPGSRQAWGDPNRKQSAVVRDSLAGARVSRIGDPWSRPRVFAVNVDPGESELASIDDPALREQVGAQVSIVSEAALGSGRLPTHSPAEFATLAIGALLALVFIEMWLAARFGVRQ